MGWGVLREEESENRRMISPSYPARGEVRPDWTGDGVASKGRGESLSFVGCQVRTCCWSSECTGKTGGQGRF